MGAVGWIALAAAGVAAIMWGAELFAEHLAAASNRLGVSAFALAVLLAGAEPDELATAVTASLWHAPAIAFGDVIGANVAICLVTLGVGAVIAPLPFDPRVRRYALAGLPAEAQRLAAFTVGWNVLEGVVAIAAAWWAGSRALAGFGLDSAVELWSTSRTAAEASCIPAVLPSTPRLVRRSWWPRCVRRCPSGTGRVRRC